MPHQSCKIRCMYKTPYRKSGHIYALTYVYTDTYIQKSLSMFFLIAIYPQAAANLQTCFGEKLISNSSEHWIINLKWDLPEGIVD